MKFMKVFQLQYISVVVDVLNYRWFIFLDRSHESWCRSSGEKKNSDISHMLLKLPTASHHRQLFLTGKHQKEVFVVVKFFLIMMVVSAFQVDLLTALPRTKGRERLLFSAWINCYLWKEIHSYLMQLFAGKLSFIQSKDKFMGTFLFL